MQNTNIWYLHTKFQFMARNTSILLGNHYDEFISKKVSSGKYASVSEVVRSALRLLEEEEIKKNSLIKALVVGEKSRKIKNFDSEAHMKKLHKKFR